METRKKGSKDGKRTKVFPLAMVFRSPLITRERASIYVTHLACLVLEIELFPPHCVLSSFFIYPFFSTIIFMLSCFQPSVVRYGSHISFRYTFERQ